MRRVILCLLWAGVLWGTACRNPVPIPVWQDLLDGNSLMGWRTWLRGLGTNDPHGVFSVTNRLLRISGEGMGYLVTAGSFRDFHLMAEWRWGRTNIHPDRVGRARDSGIFVHVTGPDGNSHDGAGAFRAGLEYNLMEGAVGDLLLIRGDAADGTLIAPSVKAETAVEADSEGWFTWAIGGPLRRLERWGRVNRCQKSPDWEDRSGFICPSGFEHPVGNWNTSEIIARGNRMEFWLNGRRVNRLEEVHPAAGAILLQCEGSEIFFRRLRIRAVRSGP